LQHSSSFYGNTKKLEKEFLESTKMEIMYMPLEKVTLKKKSIEKFTK
jgi:hypothetical protein